jgi:hypothetical protein
MLADDCQTHLPVKPSAMSTGEDDCIAYSASQNPKRLIEEDHPPSQHKLQQHNDDKNEDLEDDNDEANDGDSDQYRIEMIRVTIV